MSQRRIVTDALRAWMDDGRPCVLATVVTSSDSAPRGIGAQLAVTEGDLWAGGLSGGCAETAVLDEARRLLGEQRETGLPASAATLISMTKDTLGSVGPVCGATLGVLVEQVTEEHLDRLEWALDALGAGRQVRVARRFEIVRSTRTDVRELVAVDASVASSPPGASWDGDPMPRRGSLTFEQDGTAIQWLEDLVPAPRLVVGGAGDLAAELLRQAAQLGWRTALVDPREPFVEQTLRAVQTPTVLRRWPEEALEQIGLDARTACVAVAHDEKLDMPFLTAALRSEAFYVGSVGSRLVQRERAAQLEAAVGPELAARHAGPAGLNLGGSGAAEIALSIVSEIVARWNGRDGGALTDSDDPIRAR